MSLGENIRKYRKELDLTQETLAKKVGVIQSNVYRWERDIVVPSIETIKKIAEALSVSVDGLLFTEKERKKLKVTDKELLSKLADIDKLTPEDRTTIVNLIDALRLKNVIALQKQKNFDKLTIENY